MPIFQTGGMPPGYAPGASTLPGFESIMGEMQKIKPKPFAKAFKILGGIKKSTWKGMKTGFDAVSTGAALGFGAMKGAMGGMLALADKLGVMQPILDLLGGVLETIGGAAMGAMSEALGELADVLFSDEMMEIWKMLGETIGGFLSFVMKEIVKLLTNPAIQKLLKTLVLVFTNVVDVLMIILKPIFDILGQMTAQQLGALVYVVLVAMAFFKGLMEGSIYLAAAYGILAGIVLLPLLGMQHGGILTKPTAMIGGEAGPEAVVPLDRAGEFGLGGEAITINITGGVFATDERELAKSIAKTIRLYRM